MNVNKKVKGKKEESKRDAGVKELNLYCGDILVKWSGW